MFEVSMIWSFVALFQLKVRASKLLSSHILSMVWPHRVCGFHQSFCNAFNLTFLVTLFFQIVVYAPSTSFSHLVFPGKWKWLVGHVVISSIKCFLCLAEPISFALFTYPYWTVGLQWPFQENSNRKGRVLGTVADCAMYYCVEYTLEFWIANISFRIWCRFCVANDYLN